MNCCGRGRLRSVASACAHVPPRATQECRSRFSRPAFLWETRLVPGARLESAIKRLKGRDATTASVGAAGRIRLCDMDDLSRTVDTDEVRIERRRAPSSSPAPRGDEELPRRPPPERHPTRSPYRVRGSPHRGGEWQQRGRHRLEPEKVQSLRLPPGRPLRTQQGSRGYCSVVATDDGHDAPYGR